MMFFSVISDQAEARRLKVKEARKRRDQRHEEKRKEKDRQASTSEDTTKWTLKTVDSRNWNWLVFIGNTATLVVVSCWYVDRDISLSSIHDVSFTLSGLICE